MDDKERCQSCAMPLGIGLYGINADGSLNQAYCKLCYEKGTFRESNLTLEEMIGRSFAYMVDELGFSEEEAESLSKSIIPNLKRWKPSQIGKNLDD